MVFRLCDAHVRTECGSLVERLVAISILEWFVDRMLKQMNIQVGLRGVFWQRSHGTHLEVSNFVFS